NPQVDRLPVLWGEDFLDLSHVIEVMAGRELGDSLNQFLTALGMHAMIFPLRRRKRFQQIQICFAESNKAFERSSGVRFAIAHGLRPLILIERLNWSAGST